MSIATPKRAATPSAGTGIPGRIELKLLHDEVTRLQEMNAALASQTEALRKEQQDIKREMREESRHRHNLVAQEEQRHLAKMSELREHFAVARVQLEEERKAKIAATKATLTPAVKSMRDAASSTREFVESSTSDIRSEIAAARKAIPMFFQSRAESEVRSLLQVETTLRMSAAKMLAVPVAPKARCVVEPVFSLEVLKAPQDAPEGPTAATQCNFDAPVVVAARLADQMKWAPDCQCK